MDKGVGIGDIIVLVTAVGTATYVMGLIAVAWPIYRRITHDGALTWHAVALMPKTVVAAQGVYILFSWPLVITIGGILILVAQAFLFPLISMLIPSGVPAIISFLGTVLGSLITVYFLSVRIFGHPSITWLLGPEPAYPQPRFLRYGANILGYGILLLTIIFTSNAFEVMWAGYIPLITVRGDWVVLCVTLLFIGYFILALPRAAAINPPLPRVEIFSSDDSEVVTGRLIAHVDGFWHFFTPGNVLSSVPDDKVKVITAIGPDSYWLP
jgi:hypothetical protein